MGTLGGKELSNWVLSSSILVLQFKSSVDSEVMLAHDEFLGSQAGDFGRSIIWQEY